MRRKKRLACCIASTLALTTSAWLGLGADPAIDVPVLVEALAHPDATQRQAAQKQLETAPFDQFEALKSLAESTGDPEVRQRLARVVDAIEERMTLEPPPISLHLKNATWAESAAALQKAVGVPVLSPDGEHEMPGVHFTIDAENKPFWDVIETLARQQPLAGSGVFYPTPDAGRFYKPSRQGGFIFFASYTAISRRIDLQEPEKREPYSYRTLVEGMVDPRIPLISSGGLRIAQVVDQDDRLVFETPERPDHRYVTPYPDEKGYWLRTDFEHRVQAKPAASIASLRGEATFRIGIGQERVELALEKEKSASCQIGNAKVTIRHGAGDDLAGYAFDLNVERAQRDDYLPIRLQIHDAKGDRLLDWPVLSNTGHRIEKPEYPLKAVFSAPKRAIERTIPFELKNLELPR